ncbi:hypothetical protein QQ045_018518 [Rhodiola kirilowii]
MEATCVRATRGRHRRENQAELRIHRVIYHQLLFLCKSAISCKVLLLYFALEKKSLLLGFLAKRVSILQHQMR